MTSHFTILWLVSPQGSPATHLTDIVYCFLQIKDLNKKQKEELQKQLARFHEVCYTVKPFFVKLQLDTGFT